MTIRVMREAILFGNLPACFIDAEILSEIEPSRNAAYLRYEYRTETRWNSVSVYHGQIIEHATRSVQPLRNWSARRWRPTPLGAGAEGVSTPVRSVIISDFWYLGTFVPRHRSSGPKDFREHKLSRIWKNSVPNSVPKDRSEYFTRHV